MRACVYERHAQKCERFDPEVIKCEADCLATVPLPFFPFVKSSEWLFISISQSDERNNFYPSRDQSFGKETAKQCIAFPTLGDSNGFHKHLLAATKYEYILHSIFRNEFYSLKRCLGIDADVYQPFVVLEYCANLAVNLTNRMWFSVVCTLIDNDTRHQSGQNVVDSRGVAEWVRNKF